MNAPPIPFSVRKFLAVDSHKGQSRSCGLLNFINIYIHLFQVDFSSCHSPPVKDVCVTSIYSWPRVGCIHDVHLA